MVPIPEAHRRLRETEKQRTADRAEAEALYEKLGTPPSAILRAWARVAMVIGGALGGLAVVLLAIGGLASFALLFLLEMVAHALAPKLGVDLVDTLGPGRMYAYFALAIGLGVVMPLAITSYLRSFVALRQTLQGNLAARAPSTAGGPSTCRDCGGALDVPSGAHGVRCLYCGADNLVALDPAWVAAARRSGQRFHTDIVAAAASEKALRAEGRSDLQTFAICCAVAVPIFWVAGYAAVFIDNDEVLPGSWKSSMGPVRRMAARKENDTFDFVSPAMNESSLLDLLYPDECAGQHCRRHYTLALKKGETLLVTSPDLHGSVSFEIKNTTTFPWLARYTDAPWTLSANGDYGTSFQSPYTGLWQIALTLTGADRMDKHHLRWTVTSEADARAQLRAPSPPVGLTGRALESVPTPLPHDDTVKGLLAEIAKKEPVYAVAVTAARPDLVVTATKRTEIHLWSLATRARVFKLEQAHDATAMALSGDGHALVTTSGKSVEVWSLPDAIKETRWRDGLDGHAADVNAVAYREGTQDFASADSEGHVIVWDGVTLKQRYQLPDAGGAVKSLSFVDGGRALVAALERGGHEWRVASPDDWTHAGPPRD